MTEEEKELILAYLDDRLSPSQFDSLQALLRENKDCLLYTSPSPRDQRGSRMPSSA